jgi:signal transduction histidine kinase
MNDDRHNEQPAGVDFFPLAVVLWLAYLLTLTAIDVLSHPRPILPSIYYLIHLLDGLLVLALLHWPSGRAWMGEAFVPLVIGLLALVPIVVVNLLLPGLPPTPATAPSSIQLRQMPLLLLALILTAWQYGWWAVLLYTGSVTLLTLGFHLTMMYPPGVPFWPPLTVLMIQTVSFLVVGYFISALIRRLRQQQDELARANSRLTAYATTLEDLTISRERNRMARELHDTLAHTLSGLSVHLEMMRAYWEADPSAIRPMLDTSLAVTRSGLQETRRALKHLRASPLEDLGLLLALRQVATETAERANLQLDLILPQQVPPLTATVEQCIYRVAQEAMTNVAHHANARTLHVELALPGPALLLRVEDDGCGFALEQEVSSGHFGLAGMRERTELVGGTLTITSRRGQGTTVQVCIERI